MTEESSNDKQRKHILKCRDDKAPVQFRDDPEVAETPQFKLDEKETCSWASSEQSFGPDVLRSRIEPWLTALFQSEHLALLVGSGLTHALHSIATCKSLPGMTPPKCEIFGEEIAKAAKCSAKVTGRDEGNIEDQIRVVNELLRGLEIQASTKEKRESEHQNVSKLRNFLKITLENFSASILEGEAAIVTANDKNREEAFNYLVSFLMSFASRSGTRDRLQIFTTNYDRCIEAGADVAGLRLIDRFVGSLFPIFRSSRLDVDMHYNPPGIRGEPRYLEGVARFTKLHGSVDWVDCDKTVRHIGLPFGTENIAPFLSASGLEVSGALQLMVYPNAAKDRETVLFPYVELFRDFAAAVCRPNSTLVCYGYGFGDEHINRIIEDMLTIPSAHLVIISYDDPLGQIMKTYERLGRPAQITLLLESHLGDLQMLVDNYLPKPAIDRTTIRMAELLKNRMTADNSRDVKNNTPDTRRGTE